MLDRLVEDLSYAVQVGNHIVVNKELFSVQNQHLVLHRTGCRAILGHILVRSGQNQQQRRDELQGLHL